MQRPRRALPTTEKTVGRLRRVNDSLDRIFMGATRKGSFVLLASVGSEQVKKGPNSWRTNGSHPVLRAPFRF